MVEKCVACQNSVIRFRMVSFSKPSLLTCLCLRRKRVEKSQAILASLDGPSGAASRMVSLSNYCLGCVFLFFFLFFFSVS